jgi:hypothetical protein
MTETPESLRARFVFGQIRLIDLWQLSQLEGLMMLNGIGRVTGGVVGDTVELLGPDCRKFTFPADTIVVLSESTATFTGEKQHGSGPQYTLQMNREYDPLSGGETGQAK